MNVLILGGNGYIGSKIVRAFIKEGHLVVCTKRKNSDLTRVADINEKIKWIPASLDALDAVTQHITFDYVLNMACNYGRADISYRNVLNANIEFPLQVLDIMVEKGTKNFLTIGTGLPDNLNMYSFSKKMLGEFGKFYADKKKINFYNLRLEMFYGADEPKERFLPLIITKMINGEPVETTLGTQHRDIIATKDVEKAIMMIVKSNLKGYCEIPVGTGIAPTIAEVIDYIWLETGKKSEVRKGVIPMRCDEPDCIANTSILCGIGTWNPVPWKQGIKNMICEIGRAK